MIQIRKRLSGVRMDVMVSGAKDERDMFLGSTSAKGVESKKVGLDKPRELMEWEVSEDIWIKMNPKKPPLKKRDQEDKEPEMISSNNLREGLEN